MARPPSTLSKFILSLPRNLPVKDVIAKAKAKGLKATESNIYRVRRTFAPLPAKASHAPAASSGASGSSAERLLHAVAAEIGLARAIDLLVAERAKVRSILGS